MKCNICSDRDKLQTLKTTMLPPLILILVLACSKLWLPLVPTLVFSSSKVLATMYTTLTLGPYGVGGLVSCSQIGGPTPLVLRT